MSVRPVGILALSLAIALFLVPATSAEEDAIFCGCVEDVEVYTEGNTLRVEWTAANGPEGYHVWRAQGDEDYRVIATVDNETFTFTDENVEVGETYRYTVTAFVGDFEAPVCDEAEATAIPNFPTIIGGALASVIGLVAYVAARRHQ